MKVKVRIAHQSQYPNPIGFQAGEVLQVGRRDDEYPGWVWVTTSDGNQGWAPEPYIDVTTLPAVANRDYSSRELDTLKGEWLELHRSLNAWAWVSNSVGASGWVPAKTLSST